MQTFDAMREVFEVIEKALGKNEFIVGDRLSSIDFVVYAYMNSILTNLVDEVESKLLLG